MAPQHRKRPKKVWGVAALYTPQSYPPKKVHVEGGFHHVPQGCGRFSYCEAIGPVAHYAGLREKKQPSPGKWKRVLARGEGAPARGYRSFGENGLAGKLVRPFSLSRVDISGALGNLVVTIQGWRLMQRLQ